MPLMESPAKVFGSFPGCTKTPGDCEVIAAQNIAPELLALEPGLYKTKWFDYRRLHHSMATMLFAHYYRQAHAAAVVKYFDRNNTNSYGLRSNNIFALPRQDRTGLWKARQTADRLGIPYPIYIRSAIEHCLANCFSRMPRPSQLYSDGAQAAAADAWKEHTSGSLTLPLDPWYRMENFVGHRDQKEFQAWLLAHVGERRSPEYALAHVVYREPHLPEDAARERFGPAVSRALKIFQQELSQR